MSDQYELAVIYRTRNADDHQVYSETGAYHGPWSIWSAFDAVVQRFKADVGYEDNPGKIDSIAQQFADAIRTDRAHPGRQVWEDLKQALSKVESLESQLESSRSELAITQSVLDSQGLQVRVGNDALSVASDRIAALEAELEAARGDLKQAETGRQDAVRENGFWVEDYENLLEDFDILAASYDDLQEKLRAVAEDRDELQFVQGLWNELVAVLQGTGLIEPGELVVEATECALKAYKAEAASWVHAHLDLTKEFQAAETAWETERQLLIDERDAALYEAERLRGEGD